MPAEPAPIARRPWLLISLLVAVIGFVIAFAGFIYSVVMVGVPYQDPTPEMVRRQDFHFSVSSSIEAIGGTLLCSGVLAFFMILIKRLVSLIGRLASRGFGR